MPPSFLWANINIENQAVSTILHPPVHLAVLVAIFWRNWLQKLHDIRTSRGNRQSAGIGQHVFPMDPGFAMTLTEHLTGNFEAYAATLRAEY
ncbi:hypothetical protein GALMADRAFT_259047 [Galerina marginata CBS 339.88]|uniref:Uncharacterized protein n=1 Tax=Galerina marginata (strain CBS 339.88) TaxID=685588 RepID=A0A067S6X3_GALM3|nr:hypothetical protein GALMADRAFT_259047 [Galerina marginata CBS 339.88]